MTYGWTSAGQLELVSDAAGNTWSYSYDLRGRRVRADDPDAGVSTTVYDAVGQVTSTTDGRGVTVSHEYDELGRRTATRDGADGLLAEWTYDSLPHAKGHPVSTVTHVDGQVFEQRVLGYNSKYLPQGEVLIVPESEGGLAGEYMTLYSYAANGVMERQWLPHVAGLLSETVVWRFDEAGNPRGIGGVAPYVDSMYYTPFGETERTRFHALAGVEQHFSYQEGTRRLSGSRFHREVDPVDVDVTYTYDAVGNPVMVSDAGGQAAPGGDTQCFTYDHMRRLSGAWTQLGTDCAAHVGSAQVGGPAPYAASFSYDLAGNRTELVDHVNGST